jgi:cyclophilin family peptidyl-prolyl cis-trans isomerase/HEAT repeat protein
MVAVLLAVLPPCRLAAQTEAIVNRLAPILAAEDARDFQEGLLGDALVDPDTLVRRTAIRALGRIGDVRAVALLLPVLSQPDIADLHAETAFALGILRDSSAVGGLITWLQGPVRLRPTAVDEGILALARIGGPEAALFIQQVLRDPTTVRADSGHRALADAVRESWRLGRLAPAAALLSAAANNATLASAIYGLSRIRAKEAGTLFVESARATDAGIRQDAIRPLSKNYSRDAGLEATAVTSTLRHALGDIDPGVQINALRALGTWGDSSFARDVVPLLNDNVVNVQVTAVTTLGQLGGSVATDALNKLLAARRPWPLRREALLALAHIDTAAFRAQVPVWVASSDWRDRATAVEALNSVTPGVLGNALTDPDPRVVNAALQAWGTAITGPDPALVAAARARVTSADAMVRATSAEILGRAAEGRDVPALGEAWRKAAHDSFPDAAQSALAALHAIGQGPDSLTVRGFVAGTPAPADPLLKGWAEANWPELAEHWGPSRPITTGRTIEDYRALARQYIVAIDSTRYPRVTIEVVDRGPIVVELFGPDAPLTVANFLRLVDRGYFDGIRFHRVVPNFVIQAGDPRGDGNGGPGWSIRDEINRKRYNPFTLGMALSGPDTGGSQWFITLAAQPHLDGGYTVFGRLRGGDANAAKVVQGDQIRRIHR